MARNIEFAAKRFITTRIATERRQFSAVKSCVKKDGMLLSNSTAAILNRAWLQSKVEKVSLKYYSACCMAHLISATPNAYTQQEDCVSAALLSMTGEFLEVGNQ